MSEADFERERARPGSTWWYVIGCRVRAASLDRLDYTDHPPSSLAWCEDCRCHRVGVCDDHLEAALEDARAYLEDATAPTVLRAPGGREYRLPSNERGVAPSLRRAHSFLEDEGLRR